MVLCFQKVVKVKLPVDAFILSGAFAFKGETHASEGFGTLSEYRVSEVSIEMPRKVFVSFRGLAFVKRLKKIASIHTESYPKFFIEVKVYRKDSYIMPQRRVIKT
jgi:hypothetical protein